MPAPSGGTPTVNRRWRLDVDSDTASYGGSWVQVKGMSNFAPAINNTTQDASDYDDDLWGADAVTGRKHASTGSVLRKLYSGAFDVGQEILRAAADSLTLLHVRWYERVVGGEAYEGWAIVQWEPQGGEGAGLGTVNFTLLGQGARSTITNPYAPGTVPVPAVTGVAPATGPAAGGTLVTITGANFSTVTGAAGVKFGGTNATSYTVVSDSKIVAVAPAHAAGTTQTLVTNPTGPSIDTAADNYVYT